MCLAVPAKVIEIVDELNQIAKVDINGVRRNISIALIDDVEVGDWLLIHAGFAIQKIDEEEAEQTLALLRQLKEETPASQPDGSGERFP